MSFPDNPGHGLGRPEDAGQLIWVKVRPFTTTQD